MGEVIKRASLLDEETRGKMRAAYESGMTAKEVGGAFGVPTQMVKNLAGNNRWENASGARQKTAKKEWNGGYGQLCTDAALRHLYDGRLYCLGGKRRTEV